MHENQLVERIQTLIHPISANSINHQTKLQQLRDIRCVAFDFYGTMFISGVGDIGIDEEQETDSSTFFLKALKAASYTIANKKAGSRGIQVFKQLIKEHKNKAKEKGIDYPEPNVAVVWGEVLQKLKEEHLIEGAISQEKVLLFGIEFEFRINNIWPVNNLDKILNELLNRELTLGIISNSQFYTPLAFEAYLGESLEQFGFHPNLLIWSFEAECKKPSRQFYRLFVDAAQRESLKPEEMLYVGNDIRKDIQPAKELGMKTALYVGDQRSIRHEERDLDLPEFAPNLIIDDLHQILHCI